MAPGRMFDSGALGRSGTFGSVRAGFCERPGSRPRVVAQARRKRRPPSTLDRGGGRRCLAPQLSTVSDRERSFTVPWTPVRERSRPSAAKTGPEHTTGRPVHSRPAALLTNRATGGRGREAGSIVARRRRLGGRRLPATARNEGSRRNLRRLDEINQLDPVRGSGVALPGAESAGSAPTGRALQLNLKKGVRSGSSRHSRAAGGRRALRPPDASLEPQDAPFHPR